MFASGDSAVPGGRHLSILKLLTRLHQFLIQIVQFKFRLLHSLLIVIHLVHSFLVLIVYSLRIYLVIIYAWQRRLIFQFLWDFQKTRDSVSILILFEMVSFNILQFRHILYRLVLEEPLVEQLVPQQCLVHIL